MNATARLVPWKPGNTLTDKLLLASPKSPIPNQEDNSSGSSNSSDQEDNQSPEPIDDGDAEENPLEWHHDHWDEVDDYESPYTTTWPGEGWLSTRIHWDKDSIPNDKLYKNPRTQQWLHKLGSLTRQDLPTVKFPYLRSLTAHLPLFVDEETGAEYQILMHLKDELAEITCPKISAPFETRAPPLRRIRYRLLQPDDETIQSSPPLPRFIVPLGTLAVRNAIRHPELYNPTNPTTELTDYQVVLDAESEAMPLWILSSRRFLQERYERFGKSNLQLPIFKGLMQDEEYGYDAACILESVHRLGDRPTLQEACDMVLKTRAVVDPGSMCASIEKMEEIIGGPYVRDVND